MKAYERYLQSIYYDAQHPASYSGEDKLYREVKKAGRHVIGRSKIRRWLQSQESFSVHKQARHSYSTRKVIATYVDYMWDCDTAVMQTYKKSNDGYGYFVLAIDIFSRYIWTVALKTKNGKEMVQALDSIFQNGRKPHKFRSDKGTEYINSSVKSFLDSKHVDSFMTQNLKKANYSERCIKSVKAKLFRIMTHKQSHRWIDDLQKVTQSYNNTYHRSIKKAPALVTNEDSFDFWNRQQEQTANIKPVRGYKFSVGNSVRISHLRKLFSREYDERWTREEFSISSRFTKDNHRLYTLKDYNNEPIIGSFYQSELQRIRTNENTVYKIEKVLRRRVRNGKTELFVKWLGWSDKFCSWILESQAKDV